MGRSNLLDEGGYLKVSGQALNEIETGQRGNFMGRFADANAIPSEDWRVRITLPPNSNFAFMNNAEGLNQWLSADRAIKGVVFPYTPQVTITHNARYSEQALTHNNYKNYSYEGSDISAISIAGVFTCQNEYEALYLMSSIQFLRACTKMFFGAGDPKAGTPPTIVRLSGYGAHYMPDINCVVTQVAHTMPDDCDYIEYNGNGGNIGRMPVHSTLTVVLQPVVSRRRQRDKMRLDDFVKGNYVSGPYGEPRGSNDGGVI